MPPVGELLAKGVESSISFYLNGQPHTVPIWERYSPKTTLNDYIREVAGLKGTKVLCREAGCGCCAVAATILDPEGNADKTISINSCLCPLFAVDGWQITTVEGIGNQKEGFHPIQSRIASFNGTQCGYCTPGMVMNMYGLLHDNPRPTEQEVEDNFDGNICRCTGYRSILDSMKSFAADTKIQGGGVIDIEDLNKKLCPRTNQPCADDHAGSKSCSLKGGSSATFAGLHVKSENADWYRPTTLQELASVIKKAKDQKVRLLFGNTSTGIFKDEGPFDVYIDLREVKELYTITVSENSVKFGGNTSLSALIKKLKSLQDTKPGFHYFGALVKHLKVVGNVLVRNAASVAGNLMIKYAHHDFPSDVFTMTEAAGGKVEIYDTKDGSLKSYTVQDFVRKATMKGKVLTSLELPALPPHAHFRSYKITPRSQNAHAYVNAAFMFVVNGQQIVGQPSIVLGGINDKFFHAEKTEEFLRGKEIKNEVVGAALEMLKSELNPTPDPVHASPEYRRDLSVNLLYKTLLGICPKVDKKLQSGKSDLVRPVSSGEQTYEEHKEEWPLKQGLPKKTAPLQASGEAQYVNDIPTYRQELCGAFVLTSVANATIDSVDPSPALAIPGVVRFISAQDIPEGGANNAFANYALFPMVPEQIFVTDKVDYAGQAIGLVLAENQALANEAAEKVLVKYKDVKKPILNIKQGIEQKSFHNTYFTEIVIGKPDEVIKNSAKTVSGEVTMDSQYHFYIEPVAALCVPSEDGMDVFATTQAGDQLQCCVAAVLNKPLNYINMTVPRLGGGFGGKMFLTSFVTTAAAIAAYATGRPVRTSLTLSANMKMCGKRFPMLTKYKAGFSEDGRLDVIIADIYMDSGCTATFQLGLQEMQKHLDQGYYVPNWRLTPYLIKTNKPTSAPVRGPGPTPASTAIETILEHVAKACNKHPILVKEINLYQENQVDIEGNTLRYCTMRELWSRLKSVAEVEKRMAAIEAFNQANQWKKQGITMCAVKYPIFYMDNGFPMLISIFSHDGTVTVVQGGVEMGQGLYMKVAQAVAHGLGIPIDMIKVRANLSYAVPNSSITGGSSGSEKSVNAALQCCKILQERLAPIRAKLPPDADWKTLCKAALAAGVELGAKYTTFGAQIAEGVAGHGTYYFTYCAGVIETEVDILTGEYLIKGADIMFDCGESLNPTIDIGQIEGAFVFGLGCNLLETVLYDSQTGRVLNDGTWEYKPPTTKDIPVAMKIHLLPNAPNPVGIRSSKATGEPPTGLAVGAVLAIKQGLESAQKDLTGSSSFIPVDVPFTVERCQQGVGTKVGHLKL